MEENSKVEVLAEEGLRGVEEISRVVEVVEGRHPEGLRICNSMKLAECTYVVL